MPARSDAGPASRRLLLALSLLTFVALPAAPARGHHAVCLGAPTTIDGTSGDDRIYATTGDDVVAAFAGADLVYGRAGDDRLCGGRGGDVFRDGYGMDAIDGGEGVDVLYLCPDGTPDRWTNVERVLVSTWACV